MVNIYKKIYKEIKRFEEIIIVRHIGADPDALGSQFALRKLIKNKFPDKKIYAIGSKSNRFKFMGELDKIEEINYDKSLLIVLDTPDIKRIDCPNFKEFKNVIKIDHHPFIEKYANIELIDDNASSACQLLLEFIFKNHLKIDKEIAELIYIGVSSDTGRFMHDYTTTRTFELITKMLKKTKINFTSLYEPLYMRPLEELKFQGYIFSHLDITENKVAYIKISEELLKQYNVDSAATGNIISELKCIEGILVWIFLTEDKKNNLIRANIRSRGPVINEIASIYGGGGHKYASGAKLVSWDLADSLINDLDKETKKYIENNKK